MAERRRRRPAVGSIAVEVNVDGRAQRRSGPDLDDVLRAILWDLRQTYGGQARLARRLGLGQQNLSRIEGGGGTSLDVLSRICAALRESPLELFQRHERYRTVDDAEAEARLAEDRELNRLRVILSAETTRRLVAVLEELVDQGTLEDYVRMGESYAHLRSPQVAAEPSPRWGRKRARRTTRKKRPRR